MANVFEKAVTGFNHNIRHKGKMYHVQTEDSGIQKAHIITHLFVGGNILASKKTSYHDIVSAESLQELVKEMMEEQHKEMLRNLINGSYDNLEASRTYQPGQLATNDSDQEAARALIAATETGERPVMSPTAASLPVLESTKLNDFNVESLFGQDLITERSLDEVILSYLNADEGDSN